MSSLISLARLFGVAFVVAFFAPVCANAISMDKASTIRDQCEISIGPDLIGVVSYMPDRSRDRFCGDFPSTGRIILTIDLIAERLRQLPIEVRIVREKNGPISLEEDPAPFTVAYLPPRLYPGGAVPMEHMFDESGAYAALITVTENSGTKRTTRFAINVGGPLQFYATAMLSAVFIFGAAFLYWRYTEEKKQRDRASRAFRPT
ncbi:hypothetical protein [Methylocystis iwaonis]|uniref:Uncharacterized protein n=1 Tax=Methylocystis iwaonis TaxID=2885079 RepID=A0ABM8EAU6_9HYPH|nr:hypothetical protein [Methylocystis iwaonis]BDV35122.1 hypothetical protein SS37A_26510 [Methylocystis iwaonis]